MDIQKENIPNSRKPFGLATFQIIKGRWRLRRKTRTQKTICATAWCRRKRRHHGALCRTCDSREWRANNPAIYAYNNLRTHARARGILFELTREQFMAFCANNFYLRDKGWAAGQLHIDRINARKGYSADNIQILTCYENSVKLHTTDYPF